MTVFKPWLPALHRFGAHELDGSGHLIGGGFLRRGRAHSCIGEPGCGKSLLWVHASMCLVTGEKFFGRPVERCNVVFFAAEAGASTMDRFLLAARQYEMTIEDLRRHLWVVPQPIDLKDEDDQARAIAMVKYAQAGVFVVDTASASGAGAEDNKDMPKYSQAVSRIVVETGAAGVVIHHTPIGDPNRERGHTALRGMLDLSIRVKKGDNGLRWIDFGKARDGAEDTFGAFEILEEQIGKTNLGEPHTVPWLNEIHGARPTKAREQTAREFILAALGTSRSTSRSELRDAYAGSDEKLREKRRRNFNEALSALQRAGIIEISGDTITLANRPSGSAGK